MLGDPDSWLFEDGIAGYVWCLWCPSASWSTSRGLLSLPFLSVCLLLLNKTVINKVHLANFILWLSRALQPPPFYAYEGIGVAELFDNLNRCAVLFSMTLLRITWPMGLWTRVVFSKRGLVCLPSALQLDSFFSVSLSWNHLQILVCFDGCYEARLQW
jgi:hypothetical protein